MQMLILEISLYFDDGRIGLIDFSQVKQVNSNFREAVASVILALDEHRSERIQVI